MKNNFVAKHDFNKASVHKDDKNDYDRKWSVEDELNNLYDLREEISYSEYDKRVNGNTDNLKDSTE